MKASAPTYLSGLLLEISLTGLLTLVSARHAELMSKSRRWGVCLDGLEPLRVVREGVGLIKTFVRVGSYEVGREGSEEERDEKREAIRT